ncbi:MAG: OmpA family protein [Phaeodactylibacter sp.]|nr:OmpA family protein [Phaeodactylibacter sp.]MCB9274931.1 OmpA family protein [Lewinellaceae bacterium]
MSAPSGKALKPWVEPASADLIFKQFKKNFPPQPAVTVPVRTTESQADTDALVADQRIRKAFPEITKPVPEARLRKAVQIMDTKFFKDIDFRRQWLSNQMLMFTDIEDFNISEKDPRYHALQGRLFKDSVVGPAISIKITLQSAFAMGDTPASRQIFLNKGISAGQRMTTLIHEIVHFYAHADYRAWIDSTVAPRFYNEGLTEFLARLVMTSKELTGRTSYQDRVDAVKKDIAGFVPVTDIRKAFFQGEVWRIEYQSDKARKMFRKQVGLSPEAGRKKEVKQSGSSSGIAQEVSPHHFRFLNLPVSGDQPKPEHIAFFKTLKAEKLDSNPALKLKFIGYASDTGPAWYNMDLSRRRAEAFYQLAVAEGIPVSRLVDRNPPEHHGESKPTTDNDSVIGRAFNRRVELILQSN